ncbi:hypothetical protein [Ruegeria sp. HKCCC2117]|uniref:hypothetical protein n=1 Tax=Ruegeria sp. HKCCC2117 TaxID=2682992 RepID=UPI00148775B6|nr:hypothetical protein [Ruegeria sp. HKCCC2117]
MFDLEKVQKGLQDAVREAVLTEKENLRSSIDLNELIRSTLAKPILSFPQDIMVVLNSSRSTVFTLVDAKNETGFPPRIKIGGKLFVNTDDFLAWMRSKTEQAAA